MGLSSLTAQHPPTRTAITSPITSAWTSPRSIATKFRGRSKGPSATNTDRTHQSPIPHPRPTPRQNPTQQQRPQQLQSPTLLATITDHLILVGILIHQRLNHTPPMND